MAVIVDGAEIVLAGTVGDLFWEDSFTAGQVVAALAQVGRDRDVTIRLNSGGGIASEGAAIHAALLAHRGRKTVVVEGIAASAASIIAMAGDEIAMALGAIMMIHDPSGFTFGTVAEHAKQIEALTAIATSMAGIYAERSGRSVEEARADMREEIWLTPEQAVERGYATRVQVRAANENEPAETVAPAAFAYRMFRQPPERLVAMADRNGWNRPIATKPASNQETDMANQSPADPKPAAPRAEEKAPQVDVEAARREAASASASAERARISAIMDCDEAQGRESLARHFAFSTEMDAASAKAALAASPKAAPVQAKEPNRLEAAMAAHPNPQVGGDAPAVGGGEAVDDPTARILANYRAATGAKSKAA